MIRKILPFKVFLLPFWAVFLFLPLEESFGFPVGSNGWHLNSPFQARANADLVCKVRVLSIRQQEIVKGNLFPGEPDLLGMIATSKVISVVKGECPDVIDIEFRRPTDGHSRLGLRAGGSYTDLSQDEVCIVFLKASEPYYKLNRIWSKLRVQPQVVDYNLGDTPNLRLLAEFLAGCNSDNEMVRLQAVEEIGYLGEAMIEDLRPFKGDKKLFQKIVIGLTKAREALGKTRSCKDRVIRNMATISSFQVGDSPGIEGPLGLLRMNPSCFDPNDSITKYGIQDFCISNLQLRLLNTMDHTTRRAIVDLGDGSVIRREDGRPGIFRGIPGFDYAEFFKQALDCEVVRKNAEMHRAIANVIWIRYEKRSIPEMIRLLDDSNIHIRSTAVSALRKCINSDFSNSWEPRHFYDPRAAKEAMRMGHEKELEDRQKDYQQNEREYIQYWKKWWQENKDQFMTHETANSATD